MDAEKFVKGESLFLKTSRLKTSSDKNAGQRKCSKRRLKRITPVELQAKTA
jgi:hypothetical protein